MDLPAKSRVKAHGWHLSNIDREYHLLRSILNLNGYTSRFRAKRCQFTEAGQTRQYNAATASISSGHSGRRKRLNDMAASALDNSSLPTNATVAASSMLGMQITASSWCTMKCAPLAPACQHIAHIVVPRFQRKGDRPPKRLRNGSLGVVKVQPKSNPARIKKTACTSMGLTAIPHPLRQPHNRALPSAFHSHWMLCVAMKGRSVTREENALAHERPGGVRGYIESGLVRAHPH